MVSNLRLSPDSPTGLRPGHHPELPWPVGSPRRRCHRVARRQSEPRSDPQTLETLQADGPPRAELPSRPGEHWPAGWPQCAADWLGQLSAPQQDRLQEAFGTPAGFVANPLFFHPRAEDELFDPLRVGELLPSISTSWYHPLIDEEFATPAPLSSLLRPDQERFLFLRYNFSRMQSNAALERLMQTPTLEQALAALHWYQRAKEAREILTQANLALVLAMAKRTRMAEVDFGELVCEGNMALLRAVEKFDIARGFKFSTYACRAILKAFSRAAMKLSRYRASFPAEYDPRQEASDYQATRRAEALQDTAEELQRLVSEERSELSDLERQVIRARFAICQSDPRAAMTLDEVGRLVGVTKERVRQIQNQALEKLRIILVKEVLTP